MNDPTSISFDQFVFPNLSLVWPELFLLAMACTILCIDLFLKEKNTKRWALPTLSILTLLGCTMLTFIPEASEITFSGLFINDALSSFLKLFVYATAIGTIIFSREYLEKNNLMSAEFFLFLLFSVLGMMIMISANGFLSMYLGLELMSLCLYALVAYNTQSTISTEAGMKYFVLGALTSGLLLYGISLVYGSTGTLAFNTLFETIDQTQSLKNNGILIFGLIFIIVGIAFKMAAAPFHIWSPDVYQGAPAPVTLFIGSVSKLAAFAMAYRILVTGLTPLAMYWEPILIILAVASILLGNIVAIAQTNIKRMLAYSSISHIGFIFLALLSGGLMSQDNSGQLISIYAYGSALYYTVVYVLTSLGAFGIVTILSQKGAEMELLSDFKGLHKQNPLLAAIMMILMLSMSGIPFAVGFFAKLSVLTALVLSQYYALAVFAVIMSLIGAYYYLKVIKIMYFDQPSETNIKTPGIESLILISIIGMLVLLLGIFPNNLMEMTTMVITQTL